MNQALEALSRKGRKMKIRESTAEEWAEIVEQANVEQLQQDFISMGEQLVDDQTEEQAGVELETKIESQSSSVSISRKKTKNAEVYEDFWIFKKGKV